MANSPSQSDKWVVGASPATSHHRHQTSLETVIDLSASAQAHAPLGPAQRQNAQHTFYSITQHFEEADAGAATTTGRHASYSRPRLIRNSYDYALSDTSRDIFLRAFFAALALDIEEASVVEPAWDEPSPAYHSAVLRAQAADSAAPVFTGTDERLSSLRGACLVRDRHRCVISRKYDMAECRRRLEQDQDEARDDDGVSFSQQTELSMLEVAHILPHSLMKTTTGTDMDPSRQAALTVLNMFDTGAAHLIDGVDIDRPRNALTLDSALHALFGAFDVYFEPVPDASPNTYRIKSFLPPLMTRTLGLPVTRTLFVTDTHTIDPPSPRLLAVHRAIAHILHLSGAGEYIDAVLRDMEGGSVVRADGSSELGRIMRLRFWGWIDEAVH
ncbi:hypothetical protein SPI_06208 [Niveomyces insectorum RCEF 264]|uniref:HNH nuclease domain-containing protein n=1 Tax=Niveomyces insectorum RCEF 264 TaxID=1081102 RepID=A0A167RWD9_9HYPO|nr:hypothetical protein SPI_06208 [Niveomyces insectorum RCEF 264]